MNKNNAARRLAMSFRFAFRGIWYCIKNERNFRVHIVSACYVLFFAHFYNFTRSETIAILLIVALVIAAEMVNTAIERLVDMLSPSYNPLARLAKDIAAGAVLIFAITAVVCGVVMFWNIAVFESIFYYFTASILHFTILLLTLTVSVFFIFFGFSPCLKLIAKLSVTKRSKNTINKGNIK